MLVSFQPSVNYNAKTQAKRPPQKQNPAFGLKLLNNVITPKNLLEAEDLAASMGLTIKPTPENIEAYNRIYLSSKGAIKEMLLDGYEYIGKTPPKG